MKTSLLETKNRILFHVVFAVILAGVFTSTTAPFTATLAHAQTPAAVATSNAGVAATKPKPYREACTQLLQSLQQKKLSAEEKLKAIFDFDYQMKIEHYPEWATFEGLDRGQDRFTDISLEAIKTRESDLDCTLQLIQSVSRDALKDSKDQLNYDLYLREVKESIEGRDYPGEYLAVNQMSGVHQSLVRLFEAMKKNTVQDYENILSRLEKTPVLIQQHQKLLEEGLRLGVTPARETLKPVPTQIKPLLVEELDKNPLYQVFKEIPKTFAPEDKARIQKRAGELLKSKVIPALSAMRSFIETKYIPGARASIAFTEMPNGKAWYSFLARSHTTTELSPQQIHDIGMKETERIRREMLKVMKEAGWKKDLPSFFEFMRKDKRFFFKERTELLVAYRDIAKRVDPELTRLFGRPPRTTYGIKPVPDYAEAAAPTAYYEGGSLKAGRPGYFVANTYDLKSRPKWEMEPLTLHEAVPGHHLQIAIADEMEGGPEFRRDLFFTAFTEGWGLYAESLGSDLGLYKDPYSKMGQLTYEMWRANRLVVDAGIHSLGWSREKAIEFMKGNMPKPEHDIRVEVDRYIVMPAQALSYKIGQLKFLELRERAKKELGEKFDIRAFHDTVLGNGALPLDVLEAQVAQWIQNQKAPAKTR